MLEIRDFIRTYPKIIAALACSVTLIIMYLFLKIEDFSNIITNLEVKTLDWRIHEKSHSISPSSNIVLIIMDEDARDIAKTDKSLRGFQHGIFPDDTLAKVIKYLRTAESRAIVFTNSFENYPDLSKSFVSEVKKAGNVFIPVTFSNNTLNKQRLQDINQKFYEVYNTKFALKLAQNSGFISLYANNPHISYNRMNTGKDNLLNVVKGIGALNYNIDEDGTVRKFNPLYIFNGNVYPSLGLSVALYYLGLNQLNNTVNNDSILLGNRDFTLNEDAALFINWHLKARKSPYNEYKITDIASSQIAIDKGKTQYISHDFFRDKIVLIGYKDQVQYNLPTAVNAKTPIIYLQANIIDMFLHDNQYLTRPNKTLSFLISLTFSILISILVMRIRPGWGIIFSFIIVIGTYLILTIEFYKLLDIWLDVILPLLLIVTSFIIAFLVKYSILSKAFQETYQLAIKDGLTGLYNHRYFYETFSRDISKALRYGENISLLMLDIDNFKKINDTYGHRLGDNVLREVAKRIKKTLRKSDLVARYGGEEICVVLYNNNFDQGLIVANKLLQAMNEKEFELDDNIFKKITVSIGASTFPLHGKTASEIIEQSDKGLYLAKNNGKNQIRYVPLQTLNPPAGAQGSV